MQLFPFREVTPITTNLPRVKAINAGVKSLLEGSLRLPQFDFVYSAGLYDYLQSRLAQTLTRSLFSLVKPGGKLLLSNFLPTTPDIGYMECCMGWHLIYRDLETIKDLTRSIASSEFSSLNAWPYKTQALGYLELTKTK